jgi:hypothetical protein
MKSKNIALRVAGAIFGIVAVLHLLRIITGATFIIASCSLPIWVNVIGFIVAGFLCGWLLWLSTKRNW